MVRNGHVTMCLFAVSVVVLVILWHVRRMVRVPVLVKTTMCRLMPSRLMAMLCLVVVPLSVVGLLIRDMWTAG